MMSASAQQDVDAMIIAAAAGDFQQHEVQIAPQYPVLKAGGVEFTLKHQVGVRVFPDDGLWIYQSLVLGIESYGESRGAAEISFCEDFCALYEHIALENDDRLTPEALSVKHEFNDLIVSVSRTS
jgi:hypothetical protein